MSREAENDRKRDVGGAASEVEGWLAVGSWGGLCWTGSSQGWWITPALSWVNGHRHPSPFNNVSACIVIEMSPKMEVNMQLSHLIWEATFLPQAVDLRDPSQKISPKQIWYHFRRNDLSTNTNIICEPRAMLKNKTIQPLIDSVKTNCRERSPYCFHTYFLSCCHLQCRHESSDFFDHSLTCGFTGYRHGDHDAVVKATQATSIRSELKGHAAEEGSLRLNK